MRSCVQRFQCRCASNIFSQLCSVARGLPLIQVRGTCRHESGQQFERNPLHGCAPWPAACP